MLLWFDIKEAIPTVSFERLCLAYFYIPYMCGSFFKQKLIINKSRIYTHIRNNAWNESSVSGVISREHLPKSFYSDFQSSYEQTHMCTHIQWIVTIIETAVSGECEKPCASRRKCGDLPGLSQSMGKMRTPALRLVQRPSVLLLLEGFSGRPLCLHLCLVLYVLLILFFPKTCLFLPENHHTVQDQRGSSMPHSELFPFSK